MKNFKTITITNNWIANALYNKKYSQVYISIKTFAKHIVKPNEKVYMSLPIN